MANKNSSPVPSKTLSRLPKLGHLKASVEISNRMGTPEARELLEGLYGRVRVLVLSRAIFQIATDAGKDRAQARAEHDDAMMEYELDRVVDWLIGRPLPEPKPTAKKKARKR